MQQAVFLYPGQGAQYVGMGQELASEFQVAREAFEEADDVLGFSLSKLCFEGPEEELRRTENTQPAILATSIAVTRVMNEHGLQPAAAAGLSLGEYGALVAAGSLTYADALRVVRKRGKFMQEAVPEGQGTMAAIIGLGREVVERICAEASNGRVVEPANFNCPGQIVIAGHVDAVERAVQLAGDAGARRAIKLAVSAPFHSSLLEPAAGRLQETLADVAIAPVDVPVVANVTADYVHEPGEVRRALVRQVASPVLWEGSMQRLLGDGHTTFVELGPGKALQGFMKRIDRAAKTWSVHDPQSLRQLLESRGEVC